MLMLPTTNMIEGTRVYFNSRRDKTFPEDQECFGRKRRPDFLYDCGSHFVILEVDEFQHNRGGYDCEYKRMGEIAQALGLHTIFIRYNPDSYKNSKGRKVHTPLSKRKSLLFRELEKCKTITLEDLQNSSKYIRIIYLFYDGFDVSIQPEFEVLDIMKYVS